MNPAHRDRIAFMRICSGKFTKGDVGIPCARWKRSKLSQPQQFMAQDSEIVEEAYAGDIIGVFDPGIFQIGDTLSEGNLNLNLKEYLFSLLSTLQELYQQIL